MSKIISFIGYSGSGKTTLIEKLMEFVREENLNFGVIKHTPEGFDLKEEKDKDSFRLKTHGASRVALFSNENKVVFVNEALNLQKFIFELFDSLDLIFVEGFKNEKGIDKILVIERAEDIRDFDLLEVIAVFSFQDLNLSIDKPFFKEEDIGKLWELIKGLSERKVKIYVNQEEIPINSFVENLFYNIIFSMIKSLKLPWEEIKSIEIKWKNS